MAARTDSTRAMVLSAVLLIAPLIVGALITLYGFSPQQAGLTISIELGSMSLAGVWTYMERIGAAAAIQAQTIGNDLTFASLCGIALLLGDLTPWQFLIASCGFKFAWTFALPFMLAGTASLDTSGRILALANLMIGCGLALGPAIVAGALGTPANYSVALWVGVAGGVMSLALLLLSLRVNKIQSDLPF